MLRNNPPLTRLGYHLDSKFRLPRKETSSLSPKQLMVRIRFSSSEPLVVKIGRRRASFSTFISKIELLVTANGRFGQVLRAKRQKPLIIY